MEGSSWQAQTRLLHDVPVNWVLTTSPAGGARGLQIDDVSGSLVWPVVSSSSPDVLDMNKTAVDVTIAAIAVRDGRTAMYRFSVIVVPLYGVTELSQQGTLNASGGSGASVKAGGVLALAGRVSYYPRSLAALNQSGNYSTGKWIGVGCCGIKVLH